MSFKREGNDDRWLSLLTKRRVSELLTEDIPEDEACIIKNGRLACLVCNHRPVFDTSEMLHIHRNGKKHLSNLEIFQHKKQELQELKDKRWVEKFGDTGLPSGSVDRSSLGFLKSQKYDPRVKKRLKPNERRTVLQIDPESKNQKETDTNATSSYTLPGNRKSKDGLNYKTHSPQLKSAEVEAKSSFTSRDQYSDCGPTRTGTARQVLPQTISEYVKLNSHRQKICEVKPYGRKSEQSVVESDTQECLQQSSFSQKSSHEKSEPEEKVKNKKAKVMKDEKASASADEESIRKKRLYLQATSSGWKLDWTGQKWVKDSDVEFDSDEEPPELPF